MSSPQLKKFIITRFSYDIKFHSRLSKFKIRSSLLFFFVTCHAMHSILCIIKFDSEFQKPRTDAMHWIIYYLAATLNSWTLFPASFLQFEILLPRPQKEIKQFQFLYQIFYVDKFTALMLWVRTQYVNILNSFKCQWQKRGRIRRRKW